MNANIATNDQPTCNHISKKGKNCQKKANYGGFCSNHKGNPDLLPEEVRNMTYVQLLEASEILDFNLNSKQDKNRKIEEKNIEDYMEKIRRVGEEYGLYYRMTFEINDYEQRKNDSDNPTNNSYSVRLNELRGKLLSGLELHRDNRQEYNINYVNYCEIREEYYQLIDKRTNILLSSNKIKKSNPWKHKKNIELPLPDEDFDDDIFEDALEVPVEVPVEAFVQVAIPVIPIVIGIPIQLIYFPIQYYQPIQYYCPPPINAC